MEHIAWSIKVVEHKVLYPDETDKTTKFYRVFDTYSSYGDPPEHEGWFSWRKMKDATREKGGALHTA